MDKSNTPDSVPSEKEKAIYLLSWLDCIERLDTLLLEARHLQINIIYQLRAPTLYKTLRYEEKYLWADKGDGVSSPWSILDESQFDAIDTAHKWMIGFPDFFESGGNDNNPDPIYKEIYSEISAVVREMTLAGKWDRDQRAQYFALKSVQQLKRNIFRDKLELCHKGASLFRFVAFSASYAEPNIDRYAKFLLFRAAIIARARNYVGRLRDHLAIFSLSQDYGLLDHPRPSLERRREQHTYNVHLRDSCVGIQQELNHLCSYLGKKRPADRSVSVIFHRWQHSFSSNTYALLDETHGFDDKKQRWKAHDYIHTSYWMPERPDLQAVIAHEVAHGTIRDFYDSLFPAKLDRHNDSFSRLLKEIQQCLAVFKFESNSPPKQQSLLREIAVDLLATAVKGPAYLYALFIEIVGFGLENVFAITESPDHLELGLEAYLDEIKSEYLDEHEWYLRLHLCSTWLEAITKPGSCDDIEEQRDLILACKGVLDQLHGYIIKSSDDSVDNYWSALVKRLCDIVRTSQAADDIGEWLVDRGRDAYKYNLDKDNYDKGERIFDRSTRKLDPRLQNFLSNIFMLRKMDMDKDVDYYNAKDYKSVIFTKGPKKQHFPHGIKFRYHPDGIGSISDSKKEYRLNAPSLFHRLHDIPWQCAFFRGLDAVSKGSRRRASTLPELLCRLHYDSPLGRELYQLALDFYIYDVDAAWNRLLKAAGFTKHWLHTNGNATGANKIRVWRGEEGDEDKLEDLENDIKKEILPDKEDKEIESIAKGYSAVLLLKVAECLSPNGNDFDRKFMSRLQYIQGKKLDELYNITESLNGDMAAFRSMLSTRNDSSSKLFDSLLAAFSRSEPSGDSIPIPIPSYMFQRICIAGSYEGGSKETLVDTLSSSSKEEGRPLTLLGRYDAFSYHCTKPMCRCSLPVFSSEDKKPFPSFFTRKEMVTPVRLGKEPWSEVKDKPVYAVIAITLNRTAARLDFLFRVLQAVDKNRPKENDNPTSSGFDGLSDLIDSKRGDRVFLSDGSADLLLFISKSVSDEQLFEVFDIQDLLFEDFQVSRTEMMLSTECLNHALMNKNRNKVRITLHSRLLEVRGKSNRASKEYIAAVHDSTKNLFKNYRLSSTPGRMDFSLWIDQGSSFGNPKQPDFNTVLRMIVTDSVDRVQTNIGLIENI